MAEEVVLRPTAPFDFERVLEYLRRSPSAILERVEDGRWQRAVRLESGRPALVRVRSTGTVEAPELRVEAKGHSLAVADLADAGRLAGRVFQVGADPGGLYRPGAFDGDRVFARLVERLRGLRPVLIVTPFEALVWAIIGQ